MRYRFLVKRVYYTHKLVSKCEFKYGSKVKRLMILKKLSKKYKQKLHKKKPTYVLPTTTKTTTTSSPTSKTTPQGQVIEKKSGSSKVIYSFALVLVSLLVLF